VRVWSPATESHQGTHLAGRAGGLPQSGPPRGRFHFGPRGVGGVTAFTSSPSFIAAAIVGPRRFRSPVASPRRSIARAIDGLRREAAIREGLSAATLPRAEVAVTVGCSPCR